ncbi:hypothetical protein [Fusobacterium sp. PH5-44]|uniref:hypothetical protein n=1 Tax=unclassified Fusobacterium TaxID=2648384 RepID=UPI003D201548
MEDIIEIYDKEKNKKIDKKIFLISGFGAFVSVITILISENDIYTTSMSDNIVEITSLILFIIMGLLYMKDDNYKGKYFLKFIGVVVGISLFVLIISLVIFIDMAGSMVELYVNKSLFLGFALINNGVDLLTIPYFFQHYKKLSYFECMEDKLKYLEEKNKRSNV